MRDQAGEKGETEEARAETGTGKAAVRQNREERKGRNGNLSSQSLKRKGPKGNGSEEGQIPKAGSRGNEAESKGKHREVSCGR